MPDNLSDDFYRVAMYIYNLCLANQQILQVEDVWYGDMDLIPHTPAICVETGPTQRSLVGAQARAENDFTVYLMIYHGKVQDVQLNRAECDQAAMRVQSLLHTDVRLDDTQIDAGVSNGYGLVLFGMVTGIEPGYSVRSRTLMRTTRVTWEGKSLTNILGAQ